MQAHAFLKLLLKVAEKASQIAKIIRKEKPLLDLLIEEKTGLEKNSRFFQDFKTLADVLIQETVRHYIDKEIQNIGKSIYGEESNEFRNVMGDSVIIKVCETSEETCNLLKKVLNGNDEAAHLLAEAVHCSAEGLPLSDDGLSIDIDTSDCGIWIDPIDSTGQYIKGKNGIMDEYGMVVDGLQCVAILIGVFQKSTGTPILGVAVQPFAKFDKETNNWSSHTVWGICYKGTCMTSLQETGPIVHESDQARIVLSNSESKSVLEALSSKYNFVFASGAGYKILATALGLASAYVLSHRSIYRWDCCAIHAVLLALGGGIISYKHALEAVSRSQSPMTEDDLIPLQVSYIRATGAISSRRASISGGSESLPGIIAYRCATDALTILNLMRS